MKTLSNKPHAPNCTKEILEAVLVPLNKSSFTGLILLSLNLEEQAASSEKGEGGRSPTEIIIDLGAQKT